MTALLVPGVAEASTSLAAASSLGEVIQNLRNVIVGLLVGLATLFATIGGVRYILAGGDPGEVEAAKKTLRYAAIGYSVAVLAPVLVKLLQSIVGEPS
ncbi:pilin [Actinomadura chibensis]|uniref:pilin n=1 Tax=Actinomadura chibensis TaxID=392828 RepID=UPI001C3F36B8|nr:pilin [Actinomadura chibensis]